MDKKGLAQALKQVGTALELIDPNPFRARAYLNAARSIDSSPFSLEQLVLEDKSREIKGVGPAMLARILEYYESGKLASQADLLEQVPAGLWELLEVPNLGTKRVRTLYEALEVASLSELEYACNENRLIELPGFGPKLQASVLSGLHEVRARRGQVLMPESSAIAEHWLEQIGQLPIVQRAEITGGVRRSTPTTDCVAFLLAVDVPPAAILKALQTMDPASEWTQAQTKGLDVLTATTSSGPNLKFLLCQQNQFAYHWLISTGSEAHLAALAEKGLTEAQLYAPTEAAIYEALGLQFVPPVLRENGEEVAWAAAGQLPTLVQASDLIGVLHVHTTYSDGAHSLAEMAAAAAERGYRYVGIADHSQTASYAGGLSPERVREQWQEIDKLNESKAGARLLKGIETDILPDGRLDYDDQLMAGFEFVIASVHSSLRQPADLMMPRLLAAIAHPAVTMLGHPTNRLLLGRGESNVDLDALLKASALHGKAMELNANPHRLDLDWVWCRAAKRAGVPIAINPDAHRTSGLDDVVYGLLMAQKAGLTRDDIYLIK